MNTFTIPEGTKELKVNFETKTIEFLPEEEKFEPKDGDILYNKHSDCTLIYRGTSDRGGVLTDNFFYNFNHLFKDEISIGCGCTVEFAPATEKQKQVLFDALAKEGLKWNPETKQIEKLRWRAEDEDEYWFFNSFGLANNAVDFRDKRDVNRYDCGNYFQTQQQAEEAFIKVKELLLSL